ncbi:hypothetical protein BC628DRAFT_451971 [Trametes gibbosa]|nr:hypothetical protein BC628DRAFT_451971 [Trametes gibbosa]
MFVSVLPLLSLFFPQHVSMLLLSHVAVAPHGKHAHTYAHPHTHTHTHAYHITYLWREIMHSGDPFSRCSTLVCVCERVSCMGVCAPRFPVDPQGSPASARLWVRSSPPPTLYPAREGGEAACRDKTHVIRARGRPTRDAHRRGKLKTQRASRILRT